VECPIHGKIDDDYEGTTCPMPIRRTIAGKVEHGTCGMPLDER